MLVKYQGSNGYRVYTGSGNTQDLETFFSGKPSYIDAVNRIKSLDSSRSGDIILLANYGSKYYFENSEEAGTHGGLNDKDTYVPLIIAGPGVKHDTFSSARTIDVTPTIVNLLLGIEMSNVDGRVLEEIKLPPPDTSPPTITNAYHDPSSPTSTDAIHIYADITDASGVSSATLFYSTDGFTWKPISMINTGGSTWKTSESIPAQPAGTTLQYTVCARDAKVNYGCESGAYCQISGTQLSSENEITAQAECDVAVHTVTIGYADTAPPSIYNTYASPSSPSAYQSIEIYSEIKDDSSIASALVWYTTNGIDWNKITMTNIGGNTFKTSAPIPGQPVGTEIEYTVCAKDVNGNAACEYGTYCTVSQSLKQQTVKLLNTTTVSAQSMSLTKITLANASVSAQYCEYGVHKITVGCTDTTPPGTPTLYDPGGTINEGEYSISWSSVSDSGCSGLKYYQLQESNSPTFSTTNYYTSLTSYYITGKSSGTYYYRVRAIDNAGNAGSWSNNVDIIIDIKPPEPPTPPAPSWAAIDSFDDEFGTAFSNGNSWGEWKYEELLDDGIDNYLQKVDSFDGRSGVGLFYWGTTLGESAPQAIEKENKKGWDFSYSEGEWAVMMNNKGTSDEYLQLLFWDNTGREAATYLKMSRAGEGWKQVVWESTLILYQALENKTVKAAEIPQGAIVAQAGFNWKNVTRVKLRVEKAFPDERHRKLYFDDFAWNMDAYLEASKYYVAPGESYTLTLYAQNTLAEEVQMVFLLDGENTIYNNVPAYASRSFSVTRSKSELSNYSYQGTVWLNFGGDAVEKRSNPVTVSVVDAIAPSVAIAQPAEEERLNVRSVAVAWSGSDNYGIAYYEVRLDGGGWVNKGLETRHVFENVGDGVHTVYVRAVDKGGNSATAARSFSVDAEIPPAPAPVASPAGWTDRSNVTISWSEVYDSSGIARYEYRIDAGEWSSTVNTSFVTPDVSTGTHTAYVRAVDNAGNTGAEGSVRFYIDVSNPRGSVVINNGEEYASSRIITLSLSYEDEGSGVAFVRLSSDGIWDTEAWEASALEKKGNLTGGDGVKYVYYQVMDGVGMVSQTYSDSIILDENAPVIQETWHRPKQPTGYDLITVYANVFDASNLSVMLHYSLDGAAWDEKEMVLNASGLSTPTLSTQTQSAVGKGKDREEEKKFVVKQRRGKKVGKDEIEKAHGREIREIQRLNVKIVETGKPEKFLEQMRKHKDVEYVEEARIHAALEVMDSMYAQQWNLKSINAEAAWSRATGEGVVVAVVDTGVNYAHPELDGNYAGGYDWVNGDADAMDDNGHGTHVAGIIAAEMNGEGVVGVAPKAKILAEKVLDSSGVGYDYDVASAIVHAADAGAAVITLSLGGAYSKVLEDACEYAYGKGALLVAAAGNSRESVLYPAALSSVVAVSSVDYDNKLSSFSSFGREVELAAPGGGRASILSTSLGSGYETKVGTSMAAAHVSGAAALAKAMNKDVSNSQLRSLLHAAVLDLGSEGRDEFYGYGLIDAGKLLSTGSASQPEAPGQVNDTSASLPSAQALRTYYAVIGPIPSDALYYKISASDVLGRVTESERYNITISSKIRITSPQNKTYANATIPLIYNVSEATVWEGYSLDGGENITTGGAINTFADGETVKNFTFSKSGYEYVYIKIPKNASVVNASIALRGYNIEGSVLQGDEKEYSTSLTEYMLVKEFKFPAKEEYRYVIQSVMQNLRSNDELANVTGKITYQIGDGEEVVAFEDYLHGAAPALFSHDVGWESSYNESVTVRYYLKVGQPERIAPTESQGINCAIFPEAVGQAITKNSWVGDTYYVGSPYWGSISKYWMGTKYGHYIYYSNGRTDGSWISDANFQLEQWATCEELQVGKAEFSSTPSGAQIWIDGSNTGKVTPATIDNLAVGKHSYALKLSGYADYVGSFNVIGAKTTAISATLTPLGGSASFSSEPSGAQIWIDGSNTGRVTPATIDNLAPSSHSYVLKLEGYKDYSGSFTITGGQVTTLSTTILTPFIAYLSGLRVKGKEASTYPSDVYIDSGNDSIEDVTIAGELTASMHVDLNSTAINEYIARQKDGGQGYVNVPLKVGSTTTGILELSSLFVNYRTNVTLSNLSDGQHGVKVYSKSIEGSVDYREVYFTVDTAPLSVIIISPVNGSTHNTSEVALNYSLSKAASWIGYSLDNKSNVTLLGNTTLGNLTHGEHVLVVYANDSLGNLAFNSSRFYVALDVIAPSIELMSPANGSFIKAGKLIELNVTDNVAVASVWYSWNATNTTLPEPYDINTSSWSEGIAAIEVWANDSAGNVNHTAYYFTVDNTPPSIAIASPLAQNYPHTKNITVSFNVTDATSGVASFRAYIDGSRVANGQVIDLSNFILGEHALTVEASDNAGNNASASVNFTVVLRAEINIDPDTLNLKSEGKWITAYIEFQQYDVMSIDINTVTLNRTIKAENDPKYDFVSSPQPQDKDGDGLKEFMVKFNRSAVEQILQPADAVTLSVGGEFAQGIFEGYDAIRVIQKNLQSL
ncbi:MAG: S8 family serine peptidase [Methanobacteriota archaeon]